ncbi:aldo/keto reductase [Candidatus Woesebacteria bacterium]|nr:aldo/keto reductase [Candidatus Woesebacteria bacterium]
MIPSIDLTTNYRSSRIIKGGWQLAGGHGNIDNEQAILDMTAFAEAGITTFDCADIYTGVEELIGQFKAYYQDHYGVEKTKEIKVHTKFVPDLSVLSEISKIDVERAIDTSLSRLQVEQLDLVQFHWWDYAIPRYIEVAGYLNELQKKGKIANIGVTNFDILHLDEMVRSGANIISNQVQYSMLDNRPEHGLVEFCIKNSIKLLCYGTVAGGFLSNRTVNLPEPHEPFENRSLTKYKLIIDEAGGWSAFQEMLSLLEKIARAKQVSITALACRYILEKSGVACTIVGARNARHLADLTKIFEFDLSAQEIRKVDAIQKRLQALPGDIYSLERDKNRKHAKIMKYDINTKRQA